MSRQSSPVDDLACPTIRHDRESYADWLLGMDPNDQGELLTLKIELSSLEEVENIPYDLRVLKEKIGRMISTASSN